MRLVGRLLRKSGNTPNAQQIQRSAGLVKRRAMLDRILRVDHAGEAGANTIYEGQLWVLGNTAEAPVIREMLAQEQRHLDTFERLLPANRVRPSALLPVWRAAGFVLGLATATLGKETAMACTVAVEEAIGQHYDDQLRELISDDLDIHKDLLAVIKEFRDEELGHRDTAIAHDADRAPAYDVVYNVIKCGCHGAIWLAGRV